MSGGLCKIHGTPLNGFGTLVFCNECDAENDIQAKYDSDKQSSLVDACLEDEIEDGHGNNTYYSGTWLRVIQSTTTVQAGGSYNHTRR